ncbi:MAG: class I SAM-dependent methyltransferase [Candidatus Saccharimonadales bacterium]
MSDLRQETVDTYNRSAAQLAEYFRGIGPRLKYIETAFKLAGNPTKARVVEIGCGDGRDAKEIVKRTGWYLGFDISRALIELAREHVPEGKFEVADAAIFEFPEKLDIIFAFASLLHLNKNEIRGVFRRAAKTLNPGGIFYISSKYSPAYEEGIKEDQYGKRLFYFYNAKIIQKLAGTNYEVVKTWREIHGHTEWFEIALKKTSQ